MQYLDLKIIFLIKKMAAKLVVEGLNAEEINRSYKAVCDANPLASAFVIDYRGVKLLSKSKSNKRKIESSIIFEAVPVVSAIRHVPKFYNGSKDPVIVASDHRDLIDFAAYYFDWEAEKTREIERIESRYGRSTMGTLTTMLEPVRVVTESYPFHFGKIINGRRKSDNIAHVLCTRKANEMIRRELKRRQKHSKEYYKSLESLVGDF